MDVNSKIAHIIIHRLFYLFKLCFISSQPKINEAENEVNQKNQEFLLKSVQEKRVKNFSSIFLCHDTFAGKNVVVMVSLRGGSHILRIKMDFLLIYHFI